MIGKKDGVLGGDHTCEPVCIFVSQKFKAIFDIPQVSGSRCSVTFMEEGMISTAGYFLGNQGSSTLRDICYTVDKGTSSWGWNIKSAKRMRPIDINL